MASQGAEEVALDSFFEWHGEQPEETAAGRGKTCLRGRRSLEDVALFACGLALGTVGSSKSPALLGTEEV